MTTRAKALYNYDATRENEVALKRGDNLIVLANFGEWTYVSNLILNKKGMVPTNYIRILNESNAPPAATTATHNNQNNQASTNTSTTANTANTAAAATTATTTINNSNNQFANASQKLDVSLLKELTGRNDGSKYGIVTRTLTDNAGGKALAVKEGDIVKILEVYPTGWTNVVLVTTGAKGLISKQHYVEYKAGDPLPAQFVVEPKKEVQQQQEVKQEVKQEPQQQQEVKEEVKQDPQQQQQQQEVKQEVKQEPIHCEDIKFEAVAKFDYTSRSESELTFKEKDRLGILKDDVPGGWWLASLNGKIGHVPPGYLEKVNPDAEKKDEPQATTPATATTTTTASTTPQQPSTVDSAKAPLDEGKSDANKEAPAAEAKQGAENASVSVTATVTAVPEAQENANAAAAVAKPSDAGSEVKSEVKQEEEKKEEGAGIKAGVEIAVEKKEEKKKADNEDEEDAEEDTHDPKGELPDCPFEATAIYDYNASGSEEVSLVTGEVVTVVSYATLGWVTVQRKGKEGSGSFIGHVPRGWIKAIDSKKYNKVDISDNPDDFYKVLYTFNPNGPSQIPLKASDIVQVISKEDP